MVLQNDEINLKYQLEEFKKFREETLNYLNSLSDKLVRRFDILEKNIFQKIEKVDIYSDIYYSFTLAFSLAPTSIEPNQTILFSFQQWHFSYDFLDYPKIFLDHNGKPTDLKSTFSRCYIFKNTVFIIINLDDNLANLENSDSIESFRNAPPLKIQKIHKKVIQKYFERMDDKFNNDSY